MAFRLALLTIGLLLSVHYLDVPNVLVDALGLNVPRLWGHMRATTPFVALSIPLLAALSSRRTRRFPVRRHDVWLAALLCALTSLEVRFLVISGEPDFTLIAGGAWFYIDYLAARFFLEASGHAQEVLRWFCRFAYGLLGVHVILLALLEFGVSLSPLRAEEIASRNGLSIAGVFVLFLRWYVVYPQRRLLREVVAIYPWLLALQIWLNHSRGAAIMFGVVILVRMLGASKERTALVYFSLGIAATITILFSILGSRLLTWAPQWHSVNGTVQIFLERNLPTAFPASDDERSTLFRLASNGAVVTAIKESPYLGNGTRTTLQIRSGPYISHTLYLVFASAFGLGGITALAIWYLLARKDANNLIEIPYEMTALALLLLAMTLTNDVLIWYGLLFASVFNSGFDNHDGPVVANRFSLSYSH